VNIVAGGGWELCIKYYECVCVCLYSCLSYPASPYYIVMCGLPDSTIFFHIMSSHIRHGEKINDHTVWATILSTSFVRNISHAKRNRARHYHKCTKILI
jgi:hypothetical protein